MKLELASDPKLLGIARAAIEEMARCAGFSEDDSYAITLALGEALTNIIRHAYEGRTDQGIQLNFRCLGDRLEITLSDNGRGFDPEEVEIPPLGELRPGGWGRHIITQVMDEVQYERRQETNVLRMVKRLNRAERTGD